MGTKNTIQSYNAIQPMMSTSNEDYTYTQLREDLLEKLTSNEITTDEYVCIMEDVKHTEEEGKLTAIEVRNI